MILSDRFKENYMDEIPNDGVRLYDIVDKNGNKIESNVKLVRSNGNKQEGDVFGAAELNDIGAYLNNLEMQTILKLDESYNFADFKIIPSIKLAILTYTRKIPVANNTKVMGIKKEYAPSGTVYTYSRHQQSAGFGLVKFMVDATGEFSLSAVDHNDLVAGTFTLCWDYK